MSAQPIPNLNTLLSSRGDGSGRGRGRGRGGFRGYNGEDPSAKDRIIQRTDDDAADARMSAVALHYLNDPFAEAFAHDRLARRYPIINRGTYVRTTAIDTLVARFLSTNTEQLKQIISLGAGSDTRYFRFITRSPPSKFVYHEFDFPSNTTSKINTIKHTPALSSAVHAPLSSPDDLRISSSGDSLYSSCYNIHPVDLRQLVEMSSLPNLPNLSTTAPTLILSECCLCYLPPETTVSVLRTLSENLVPSPTPLALIIYEPIKPDDAFGRMMVSNLASRGIHLQTLHTYSTLAKQRARLKDAGFIDGQEAADVGFLWKNWVTPEEKDRVSRCEMLDEVEEWTLLAGHYCITWGCRSDGSAETQVFDKAWKDLPRPEENSAG